ncbi:MAG: hypothetical protein WKF86_10435 [Acidimicrobiales bacterium]
MADDVRRLPSIELVVEGPQGEVTLQDVIATLQDSLMILRQVGAVATGREQLDWVVSGVSLGSFRATIEPRSRSRPRKPGVRPKPEPLSNEGIMKADLVARTFANGLQEVEREAMQPEGWTPQSLRRVEHLGRHLERSTAVGFTVAVRSTEGDVNARVNQGVGVRAEYAREGGGTRRSRGSLIGRLEVISARKGKKTFGLYTTNTGPAVRCFFGTELQPRVMNAFETRVVAEGIITRKADGQPVSILVDQFEVIAEDGRPTVDDLRGCQPDITGGLESVDFIRQQRRAQ